MWQRLNSFIFVFKVICVVREAASEQSLRKRDTNNLVNHRLYESEDAIQEQHPVPWRAAASVASAASAAHPVPWGAAVSAAYARQGLDQEQLQVSFYVEPK